MALDCFRYPIPPKVVAIATDKSIRPPLAPFPDSVNLPGVIQPQYGQDITAGYGGIAPGKQDAGATPEILKPKMRRLLTSFAAKDRSGMAARLFDAFLSAPGRPVTYFDDPALNAAAAMHPHIRFFCNAALSAPNSPNKLPSGVVRIHQALKNAGWDITKIHTPANLGVPAFNQGIPFCQNLAPKDFCLGLAKLFSIGDFDNGLGLMINGVQHVYVVATHYRYDQAANQYCIRLKYIFYDVFGLDDDDLKEYGVALGFSADSTVGITAWWQLQHQHNYTPLITRVIVEKTHVAPAR